MTQMSRQAEPDQQKSDSDGINESKLLRCFIPPFSLRKVGLNRLVFSQYNGWRITIGFSQFQGCEEFPPRT